MILTDAFNIVMTITTLIVMIVIIYLLIKLIKHNDKVYREQTNIISEDLVSKNQMKAYVDNYINKIGPFGSFSMFLVDIDDFSGLNQVYGETRCDAILQEFVKRITKFFNRCIVTRHGADQILVFAKEEYTNKELQNVMDQFLEVIREPYSLSRFESIPVTATISIATYPTCGSSLNELVQSLELAGYVCKRNGGNNYMMYHSDLEKTEINNLEYFKEVRAGIEKKEFCLYYQPIIDMKTKSIYGFESFMRWNHPTLGLLTPQKFIHILEASGDISFVSKWGLEQTIFTLLKIQENLGPNNLIFTINLSTKQLMSLTVVDDFKKLIHKYKVNPAFIMLEIAEYAMYEKLDVIKSNLLKLRDIGFKISVDGLGLDYSTLTQIEKEPIDVLKLDREFLEDIENNYMKEKFVNMLVDSANRMKRIVIAEGVESFSHVKYICSNNINYGQGFYFSKPIKEDDILDYIESKDYIRKIDGDDTNVETLEDKDSRKLKTLHTDSDTIVHDKKS